MGKIDKEIGEENLFEFYSLMGLKLGKALAENYNKIFLLILNKKNELILNSSIFSKVYDKEKSIKISSIKNTKELIDEIINYNAESVVMLNEKLSEKLKNLILEIINGLLNSNYEGDFFLSNEIISLIKQQRNIYLNKLEEKIYSFEINEKSKKFYIYYYDLENDKKIYLREYINDCYFVELLKRCK